MLKKLGLDLHFEVRLRVRVQMRLLEGPLLGFG